MLDTASFNTARVSSFFRYVKNPAAVGCHQSDMSKSQSTQQPSTSQASSTSQNPNPADPATLGEGDQLGSTSTSNLQSDTTGSTAKSFDATDGQSTIADYGSAESADAMTQNRSDVEGSSMTGQPGGQQSGGFVGSDSQSDTSSELIDDEDDKASDGE